MRPSEKNERARFEAEAGKTYYFKWTAGTMATMIKATPVEREGGAKAISKTQKYYFGFDTSSLNGAGGDRCMNRRRVRPPHPVLQYFSFANRETGIRPPSVFPVLFDPRFWHRILAVRSELQRRRTL